MPHILTRLAAAIEKHRGLILPIAAASLIFVIIVPMPPALMDVLLAANLAFAAIILLTTIYVASPLEFSVFPSILLVATLVRLVLSVATTRLVLTAGAGGAAPEQAQLAAGKVVWAFSAFVPSGSLAVGVILFAILVVVQFVVITKGAGRVSEVAARFILDSMPGKQLAVDSELNAKLIDESQARQRRAHIAREADFYGAMDGASRFLRGDAVASVLIILVNILGGMYVGLAEYGWSWPQTVDTFTRLTIGDGLVTQIPALIISISAALLVTRSGGKSNLGEDVLGQLGTRPVVLSITAALLVALMLTSLPKAPLLLLACALAGLAVMVARRAKVAAAPAAPAAAAKPAGAAATAARLPSVEALRIDLGFSLVRLAEGARGDLLGRIASLREQIAQELGLLVPPVRIRDDMRLESHAYAIALRGARVASGKIYVNQLLAVAGGNVRGKLLGREAVEPVTGAPAVWVSPAQRARGEAMGYAIVEPCDVLVAHLGEVIRGQAAELLGRQQTVQLLEGLRAGAAHLVDEVTAKLKVLQIQKVLQGLLAERVSIRDLEAILEGISDGAESTHDPRALTEYVRGRLARSLSQQYASSDGRLWCVNLAPAAEDAIRRCAGSSPAASGAMIPPALTQKIAAAVAQGAAGLTSQGRPPVVLCAPGVRSAVKQMLGPAMPRAAVLAYSEIDSVEVQTIASVGTEI